jgi:hypothetical protein
MALALGAAVLVGACGAEPPAPSSRADDATAVPGVQPAITPVPGGATAPPSATAATPAPPGAREPLSGSCSNIDPAPCDDQAAAAGDRHPDAVAVEISCTARPCDRRHGTGIAHITLANGSTLDEPFTYAELPSAAPVETCTGIPAATCAAIARDTEASAGTSLRIVSITITCRTAPCTTNQGEADTVTRFEDGSTEQGVYGWNAPIH